MSYRIKVWIPVDDYTDELYDSLEEAENDVSNMEFMQPENRYEIEEVVK